MRRSRVPAILLTSLLVAVAGCAVHDSTSAVAQQWGTRALLFSIGEYRHYVSPHMHGLGVQCRFKPTCSLYGYESVRKYGALKGGWRAAKRISRCRASTPLGTVDPP